MKGWTKLAAALLVLAAAVAVVWLLAPGAPSADEAPSPAAADSPAEERAPSRAATRHAAVPETSESPTGSADALPAPVDLDRADRDLDLHGIVVDADGQGVAGARIAVVAYPWRVGNVLNVKDRDAEAAGPTTRSARDGTFAVRLARGEAVSLRVAADGYAPVELPSVLAGERVRVVVRPGVRLVVAVTDAADAPAAGAAVRIFNSEREGGPAVRTRAATGADGVAAFENLPPGVSLWIAVEHEKGYGGWTKAELPASGDLRVPVKLPAARTIRGTVVDAATRAAVPGARVGMNWVLDMAVTTKDDGSFELHGWTGNGVSDLHVLAEGFAREAKKVGTAERLDFELARGYAVTGRVVAADGLPVTGALVSLIASEMSGGDQRTSDGYATTAADGRFRVTSLRAGMRHALVVMAPGFARLRRDTPVATSSDDVALGDVALAAPRRIEGVVLAVDGTPQARVPVTLGASASEPHDANWYGRGDGGFTDDLGRFRFAGVAPGAYTVTARPRGAQEVAAEARVPADADVLDVKLVREATREIGFTVTDARGDGVAGVVLNVSRAGERVQARTDASGAARVSVRPGEGMHLSVWPMSDGARTFVMPPTRALRADEADVRVVLADGAELQGRLVDPDGAPVARANLHFRASDGAKPYAVTSDDGRFRVIVPPAGTTTLDFDGGVQRGNRMEDSGLAAHVEGLAPASDLVVRCERIARDRTLVVIVVSPAGAPVAGANVNVYGASGPAASAKTDATGRVLLADLPARELSVAPWIQSPDFLPPAAVKVTPAGQELRLACRAASRTTGTVVGEGGAVLAGGMVTARRGDEAIGYAQVDHDGRFTMLLPLDDTAPVSLHLSRTGGAVAPDAVLDGVIPGTQGVLLVVKK